MPDLLIVGGGLFGSQAAAYARSKGMSATVFDAGLARAASPAAAGLFKDTWLGRKLGAHYRPALTVLERLYEVRSVPLTHDDGTIETLLCVPPTAILEPNPVRQAVTAVGDGWLESGGRRHEGCVYVAAGVWCEQFLPALGVYGLGVYGKAGSSFVFAGDRPGRIRPVGHGRQAIAFVRDPGTTHFSDGTAERNYTDSHDRATLERAAALGLDRPLQRFHGERPYTPGGPVFRKIGSSTWLATGGRKMGTLLGASFARRLIEEEIG
jgi:glycine/D-amino acid oxidase-like deaminating enzyme